MDKNNLLEIEANVILNSKKGIALTGAGISVESGLQTFRGKNGLWEKYDPNEFAHISAFKRDPSRYWTIRRDFYKSLPNIKPNNAHLVLAKLEKMKYLNSVITQNIDGLHHKAGNKNVIEFHGNAQTLFCMNCNKLYETNKIKLEKVPPLCKCGGVLKPNVVFFGESIPVDAITKSQEESQNCDLMLVIGTSAVVYPAASLPIIAKNNGAKIIEINKESTELTDLLSDYFIQGNAGEVLPAILKEMNIFDENVLLLD